MCERLEDDCIQFARDKKEKLEICFFELLVQSSEAYDTSVFFFFFFFFFFTRL